MHPECILEDTMNDAVITFVTEDTEGSEQHVITKVFRVEFESEAAFEFAMEAWRNSFSVLNIEQLTAQ
jgi:hypothetical protein